MTQITVIFALGSFIISANAATYYVGVNGSDSYSAAQAMTASKPWATITRASKNLKPGDEVVIESGDYAMTYSSITANGNKRQPIIFAGETPQPRFTAYNGSTISITKSTYIVVKNLDITNADHVVNSADGGNGISIVGGSNHITIEGCTVHDCGGGGIGTGNQDGGVGCDYITVKGNIVFNNAWYSMYQCSGISFWMNQNADPSDHGYHNFVIRNICYGNGTWKVTNPLAHTDGNAIIIDVGYSHVQPQDGHPSPAAKTYVGYNTCYNNGGRGVHVFLDDGVTFDHNTCYHDCQDPNFTGGGEVSVISSNDCVATGNVAVATNTKLDQCFGLWNDNGTTKNIGNLYFDGKIDGPTNDNRTEGPEFKNINGTPPDFRVKRGGPADPNGVVLGACEAW